jgi:uncharacterized delta-60 repeat protein
MRLLHWLRSFAARPDRAPARRAPRRPTCRPRLEALEDRLTPSGGLLDPTFNGTGIESFSKATTDRAYAVAVQPDGKIVSVGYVPVKTTYAIEVSRLNPDGSFDTTFNGTGAVTLSVGTQSFGQSVALQPDGKILVGGRASVKGGGQEDVVARLNANGSLDAAFGNTGRQGVGGGVWTGNVTSGWQVVEKLATLTDASNHVTGVMAEGIGYVSGHESFAAIKLTAAGQLDASFGTGGMAVVNAGGVNDNPLGMAVTPTGGVVMVGAAGQSGAAVALTPSGQLDTTFNGTGIRVDSFQGASGFTYFDAVAIQQAASGGYGIVVAGKVFLAGGDRSSGLVDRYTSAGQLDSTLGTGGLMVTSAAGQFNDVGLEADGSIVVAGYAWYTNPDGSLSQQLAVGHLSADGSPDTTFGAGGTGISVLPPLTADTVFALAIDPDGRIVVASQGNNLAEIARFTAP